MAKTRRTLSPYATEAAQLFGQLLRKARIERKITTLEAAERAGISRGLLRRIEAGDPRCAIGALFEVAAIVGVKLFDAEPAAISRAIASSRDLLTLLPKSIRLPRGKQVNDDF
jgi:transcriptional regulator with XRE-family HTH domain